MTTTDDGLRGDLLEIDGVGDATADRILDVVNGHSFDYPAYVEKAFEAAESGRDRDAGMYLRRAQKE